MKTFVLVFLSLFLSKSCQNKKEGVNGKETVETEIPKSKPTGEIGNNNNLPKTNNQETGNMVIYEAMSRGYFTKIIFQNDKLFVSKDRNNAKKGEPVTISPAQATEINTLLKSIKPQTLPNLKWPTEKRFYDGAAHANLTIVQNGETFVGGGFDHGFPPAEIEKLVTKLISIAEKK